MPTIAGLLRARVVDPGTALRFEEQSWSYAEYAKACAERAAYLLESRLPGPFHVGVLLENVPEFAIWLGAAALAGAAIVGINPTRRGAELARDVTHAQCQLLLTDSRYRPSLQGLELGIEEDRILEIDSARYAEALRPHRGSPFPDVEVPESALFLLIFTSGTSGAPKACLCSQGRLAMIAEILARMQKLSARDVCYLAMPMFHSNALMAGWAPALAAGATCVLRRRFSASGFLDDVRRYGVTYFNYVGRPLAYILATPERPDDSENTLVRAFGNEATDQDIERFQKRFGCIVTDAFGSTEGVIHVTRTPDMPPGALGRAAEGVAVLEPETGTECPPARFDEAGRLLNPEEAIGELVHRTLEGGFEGYWNNQEASTAHLRDGAYWSGDLAYRDEQGFLYFAGRDSDWLRVDGENFAAAPVERILTRFPGVALAAVYPVPDPIVGDQVMAALQLVPGAPFDPERFASFLEEQSDLGTKWAPRLVRICEALPVTETHKIVKRALRRERWECDDPVWWRPEKSDPFRRLTRSDAVEIAAAFAARGRSSALERI
jgi:fatty-acyl-CoA synthase